MTDKSVTPGVPYLSLQDEFLSLQQAWFSRIEEIGAGGAFILGPNVRAFEQEAAAYVGSQYAVAVANGTDALVLSLRAMDIGPGDEVITSPFTFFATAEAISIVGAIPVFADIDEASFNLDPGSVASRIGDKTKAILPVHIFGNPADMSRLGALADTHGLRLLEDAAQAFGARHGDAVVGSMGDAGCFSFYPTKVLGCYGDGGLITTSDEVIRDRLLKLRNHGATAPFTHDELGYNSRLDEVQAALLRLKLEKLEQDIAARLQVAAWYDERLAGMDLITPVRPAKGRHAFNLYTIKHPRRDALRAHLNDHKIGNSQCYPVGLHLQTIYSGLGYQPGDLPVVDRVCGETLSLPIFPAMRESQVDQVCDLVAAV
ncbi:DegT/DnrJ/EryC1/StrS family aminotransferase [Sedimenticola selenatireducens]|uniref:DegT/DnrJ/EryC1/StrS family aminotransferase n=1 Tax=Sedimenticola selenatireducens TaxID=191960 RepID=UPI0021B20D4F|nr:DegT/DnrJ/EryC1/StrS family aminotransferase [Sedimenticola selenatireducens]